MLGQVLVVRETGYVINWVIAYLIANKNKEVPQNSEDRNCLSKGVDCTTSRTT